MSAAGLLAPLLCLACPDGLIPARWPAAVYGDTVIIAERLISAKTALVQFVFARACAVCKWAVDVWGVVRQSVLDVLGTAHNPHLQAVRTPYSRRVQSICRVRKNSGTQNWRYSLIPGVWQGRSDGWVAPR